MPGYRVHFLGSEHYLLYAKDEFSAACANPVVLSLFIYLFSWLVILLSYVTFWLQFPLPLLLQVPPTFPLPEIRSSSSLIPLRKEQASQGYQPNTSNKI